MNRSKNARVALFGPLPPPYGGVAVHVERLHEILLTRGFDSRVLSFGSPTLIDSRVRAVRFGPGHWPLGMAALASMAGRGGLVHNHTHFAAHPRRLILESLSIVAKLWKLRWVETLHDQTIVTRFPDLSPTSRRLFVRAMTNATRIIAIGTPLRDFLIDVGIPEGNIVVGQPLLPPHEERLRLPERYVPFFAEHSPILITIGALIPLYDIATIGGAFREMLAREPRAGLVIVASGFASDPAYEGKLWSSLSNAVADVLLVRDIPHDEVGALLQASTVFIRGSQVESFGLSRIEALFAGIPVVATDAGQTRFMTIYRHGSIGSLISAIETSADTEPDELQAAARYYTDVASASLETILKVYEDLGVRPAT
jgi:glycosyltransferase involved in cell wall biosynthesis